MFSDFSGIPGAAPEKAGCIYGLAVINCRMCFGFRWPDFPTCPGLPWMTRSRWCI